MAFQVLHWKLLIRAPCAQAQKKRAEDMIVEEDKIDGLELVECKVFK